MIKTIKYDELDKIFNKSDIKFSFSKKSNCIKHYILPSINFTQDIIDNAEWLNQNILIKYNISTFVNDYIEHLIISNANNSLIWLLIVDNKAFKFTIKQITNESTSN
jgi:hypothetical protein